MFEFKLPDVGEGLTEADILEWQVAAGDTVEVNQTLLEIETAKSAVELPSPVAGTVSVLHVEPGQTVPVGTVIVSIEDGIESSAGTGAIASSSVGGPATEEVVEERPSVLVGPGPSAAVPRTRRLARRSVAVPEQDAVATLCGEAVAELSPGATRAEPPPVAAQSGDRETRTPIKGVRKAVAAAMTSSAFSAPHVTLFLTADVTRTMELLAGLEADRHWSGVRLTPLVLVARALLMTIRRHPGINARWDEAEQEIVEPHFVNLGVAAATPRGLIVPNIKEAQDLDLAASRMP